MLQDLQQSSSRCDHSGAPSPGFYPEECRQATECASCVERSAHSVLAVVGNLTADGAARLFRKMYSNPGCLLMEHSFVYACCGIRSPNLENKVPDLVHIVPAA